MRRWPGLLLVVLVAACGDEAVDPVTPPARVERRERPPRRPRAEPDELAAESGVPSQDLRDREARTRSLLRDLVDSATREGAELRLDELPDAERLALLRRGLQLAEDLALESAKRLEYHHLDADESERFVELLLPHLFDEEDEFDFEELRSALGSSEIAAVLQEMREHESIAGERSLLGALHRQLRAEHLPALVEMALSRDRALAEQAFEEIAIVAMYTNRHRNDVARIFAGRAAVPQEVGGVPADLVVALRVILADETIGEVRRSMFLAWALRWLRDCGVRGRADAAFLRELIETARVAPGLGAWERENVQICALLGVVEYSTGWLEQELEENAGAWTGDAGLAAKVVVLADGHDDREARSLAGAVPLALALLLELDRREGEKALFEALDGRKAHAALEFMDDVYHARFRFRLPWKDVRRRDLSSRSPEKLDPALMLRLAVRYPEFDSRDFVQPFLSRLKKPGGLARGAAGQDELHDGVLPSIEGDALRDVLRAALVEKTADDSAEAARLLALLRDKPSESALIDLALAGRAGEGVLADVAEWASSAGRDRIRAWLRADGTEFEMQTLGALGRLPRALARRFGEEAAERLRDGVDHADEVVALLREGDAVGALLLHLDVNVHDEIDGVGRIDDPRVRAHLRTWVQRREDGRMHWALGELALAGDSSARSQIEEVVEAGRYRWVDDAAADVLLLGGAQVRPYSLGYWAHEAESNCCRAVAVKRVFEDAVRLNVTEAMSFQPGTLVTVAEWLRWRLGKERWLTTDPLGREDWRMGDPKSNRALVWSDLADGYVPSLR